MDVGQVGFHVDKNVKEIYLKIVSLDFFSLYIYSIQVKQAVVDKKQNEIVNRLNKTKTEVSTEDFIVKFPIEIRKRKRERET